MSRDPDRKGRPAWRRIVGFLLIVMSSLCVALSTGCVQALERRVPDIELTFGGKFALLLFTLPVYFCKGQRMDLLFTGADLGFPVGRGANPPDGGANIRFLPNFPEKVHEIENLAPKMEGQ